MNGASTYGVAVITVGIDLASQPGKTGLARVRWTNFGARVQHLAVGIDDDAIVEEIRNCDKAGIDCPFGWPVEFVDFVSAHREARPRPPMEGEKWSRRLDEVRRRAPWLDLGDHEALCQTNDDAFDAVIAVITARAAALDLVTTPFGDDVDLARVEGWIAVPCAGSLDALVGE